MSEPHDDLDELLAPKPGTDPDSFRESLFAQTERRVVWNCRVRFIPKAIVVPAIFILGLAVGVVTRPNPGRPKMEPNLLAPVVKVVTIEIPVPVPQLPESSGPIAATPDPATASDAELRAELADDPAEAARLYRTAGDKYLNDGNDYPNAARCYRLFLSRAGSAGLNPESGDTWLLTSLKNAAFKEKAHDAKTGG